MHRNESRYNYYALFFYFCKGCFKIAAKNNFAKNKTPFSIIKKQHEKKAFVKKQKKV
jgi:hypothetical protein